MEKFWICENKLKKVENLPQNLKEFWVGLNFIEKLDNFSFENSKFITELNIAGNFLCSFNDLKIISDLEELKILSLNDPNFGENPICLINNYRLILFNKLSKLEILDEIFICKEDMQENKNIVNKKNNYYKNRIKQMNRISRCCFRMLKSFNFFYKHLKLLQIYNMKSRIKSLEYIKYERKIYNKINDLEKIEKKNNEEIPISQNDNQNFQVENLNKNLNINDHNNIDFFINEKENMNKTKYDFDLSDIDSENDLSKDNVIYEEINNEIRLLFTKKNKAIENMRTCDYNYKVIKNLISEINDFHIVR